MNIPDALFTFYDLYIIEDLEKREIYISTQEKFNSIENYENKIENILNIIMSRIVFNMLK